MARKYKFPTAFCWLLVGACLWAGGCDDAPPVSAEVEARARELEKAEQEAIEEAARRRQQRIAEIVAESEAAAKAATDGRAESTTADAPNAPPSVADANASVAGSDASTADRDDVVESRPDAPSTDVPASPVAPPSAGDRAAALQWSQMRAAMTMQEVLDQLGKPTRVWHDIFLTYWFYGTGRDAGKVAFIRATQRTLAWDPPLH